MAESWKLSNFWKQKNFMNFKCMMPWVSLDDNTSLRTVVNNVPCSEDLYPRKPPSFCPHRRKNTFFRELLSFKASFFILGQQVLTKIFAWKQSPNFILQNPGFDFFISYVVPEIFLLLGSSTRCQDFQITTFILL